VNVAVIGSGSWGTALAMVLTRNEHHVTMWSREPETASHINYNLTISERFLQIKGGSYPVGKRNSWQITRVFMPFVSMG
jgi:glycerol-3-phosphate dehydrogenase